jgi:hypothetical protein
VVLQDTRTSLLLNSRPCHVEVRMLWTGPLGWDTGDQGREEPVCRSLENPDTVRGFVPLIHDDSLWR